MKVWIVSHAYAADVNHDKLVALARLPGLDLTVLTPAVWRTSLGELTAPAPRGPYRVVPARVAMNGRLGAYVYRDGLGGLRAARPDIVHAELEPWSLAALQCILAAGRAAVVLFTWENLERPLRAPQRVIERVVLRRAAFVIAGNAAAKTRIERRGVPSGRIAVLPQFGVDFSRYAGERAGGARAALGLTPPIVGYIGRLVPEKGVDLLVEALAGLEASLLVVGEGPARRDLERRVVGWPPGRVRFIGAVAHACVPAYLGALDALVLPSRTTAGWAEQFGHVLIEAMAAGVPVVGSSSGAIPETIADAGLGFPEGRTDVLRERLGALLGDRALHARLVDAGRSRVQVRYTNDVIACVQAQIYARVLARSPILST
jgi:glycosyltransferase involved in cell wall biosynthesis